MTEAIAAAPPDVRRQVDDFVAKLREALGSDLRSVVLYGSGAEGRLRPTSDVNLIVVLRRFDPSKLDGIRDPLRVAHAAIRLSPMFVLEDEIPDAARAFAVKFADVRRRHAVLHGDDPFRDMVVPRDAEIARLRQVLLNLALRLRRMYLLRSPREEQVALLIADTAGPLRASAAALLELEGRLAASSPKEALEQVASSLPARDWTPVLRSVSMAREEARLAPGVANPTLLALIDLAAAMRARASRLS